VRLQTWFPFEIQVGLNGREWLSRQMDQEGLRYRRSDNKFLHVAVSSGQTVSHYRGRKGCWPLLGDGGQKLKLEGVDA
jgi:hypothetical protein